MLKNVNEKGVFSHSGHSYIAFSWSIPISNISVERVRNLLPTGSEEREVLGVGSILVAILPSCQYMTNTAL